MAAPVLTASSFPPSTDAASTALLYLLQLASPSLPVGAYSYSEGLETLVQDGTITTAADLERWLRQELRYGTIRLEGVAMAKVYETMAHGGGVSRVSENSAADNTGLGYNLQTLNDWNDWLSALRETAEIREQSWQMGRTLVKLLRDLDADLMLWLEQVDMPCNFAIAFAIAACHWTIEPRVALLGYFHSWLNNLINAGIKLVPLGQTTGQQLLQQLYPDVLQTVEDGLTMPVEDFGLCNWGMTLASMGHETLYSRLFRS